MLEWVAEKRHVMMKAEVGAMQEPQGIASSHSKLGGRKTGSFPSVFGKRMAADASCYERLLLTTSVLGFSVIAFGV